MLEPETLHWVINNHLPDNFVILWGQEGSYMVIKHHWGHNLYGLPSTPGRPPVLLWVHRGLEMCLLDKKIVLCFWVKPKHILVCRKIEWHRMQSGTVLITEPHLGTSVKSLISENCGNGNHTMWTILRIIT